MGIIGIEQSTDSRDKQTKFKKFTTINAANKWKNSDSNGRLTHGEHAETQRNYHHTFRSIYEVDARKIRKAEIHSLMDSYRHSVYRLSYDDAKAEIIKKIGTEL